MTDRIINRVDDPAYPQFENIPLELRQLSQFVGWKYGKPNKHGKRPKVPYNPHSGKRASSTNPATWGTYDQAVAAMAFYKFDGIGIVTTADDGYTYIDLDHCIHGGKPSVLAMHVAKMIETYVEITPSGEGLRVVGKGQLVKAITLSEFGLEAYDRERFLTTTGHRFEDAPDKAADIQDLLNLLEGHLQPLFKADHAVRTAAGGDGNNILNRETWWLVKNTGLDHGLIRDVMLDAATFDGRRTESEALGTIDSAIKAGSQGGGGIGGTTSSGQPRIQVNLRQTRDITADAVAAIVAHEKNHPTEPLIYVRDATLERVVETEPRQTGNGRLLEDRRKIVPASKASLTYILGRVAEWNMLVNTTRGVQPMDCQVPDKVLVDLMGAGQWPEFPPLAGISYCPTFTADGSMHSAAGYDRRTGLYHAESVPIGDTTPTLENVNRAVQLIDELLHDFPFADKASWAHSFAMMLLPFVRDPITGPTPLHAVDAPTAGTGKGLLAEVVCYVARGHELTSIAMTTEEPEWQKKITSVVLEGRTHVNIDNINAPLDSGTLASALTQARWGERTLGVNRTVDLPIRHVWIATGNNLVFSEEIARRTVHIRLDADMERPDQRREFLHPDLKAWVRENRPALVTACCTLVQNWFDKGKPLFKDRVMGSYEEWTAIVGGILQAAGVDGFLDNMDELWAEASTETEMLRTFIAVWAERYGEAMVPAEELIKVASYPDILVAGDLGVGLNLLSDVCTSNKEAGRRRQMGRYIKKHRGKVVRVMLAGGEQSYKIQPPAATRDGAAYRLKRVDGVTPLS